MLYTFRRYFRRKTLIQKQEVSLKKILGRTKTGLFAYHIEKNHKNNDIGPSIEFYVRVFEILQS
jgi:hypothetical protein